MTKLNHLAIWTIYWSAVAAGLLLLVWAAKVAIKNLAERYRDPLGRFEYGERHSDYEEE